jgi:hypothetical protein
VDSAHTLDERLDHPRRIGVHGLLATTRGKRDQDDGCVEQGLFHAGSWVLAARREGEARPPLLRPPNLAVVRVDRYAS